MTDKKRNKNNVIPDKYWVRTTKLCNQRCLFCLDKESQDGKLIPFASIMKDLRFGLRQGAARAILSGGEATIHPDFIKIVNFAKKIGYKHVQVITNGQKFSDSKYLDLAVKAGIDEITVSVHGHTSSLHDMLVGRKGAFVRVLRALKNAKKYSALIVSIDICVNKLNYRFLSTIVKMFINLGFYEFDLLAVVPFGRAWDERHKMLFDFKKAMPYLEKTFSFQNDPRIHLWTNRFPAQYLEGYEKLIQSPSKLFDEIYGRKELFNAFLINGKVPYCWGPRCSYCFIGGVCKDIVLLLSGNKLFTYSVPKCLPGEKQKNIFLSKKDIIIKGKIDLKKFLDFWVANRYFVKSIRCKNCKYNNNCAGAPIDKIINKGFKILKPHK